MTLLFRPMDAEGARTVLAWRYPAPYDLYHVTLTDAELPSAVAFLSDAANAYYRMDRAGELEAFCCYGLDAQVEGGDYRADALDLGLGVRPDLTGRGQGAHYAQAVVRFGVQTYAPVGLRVTIAAFNQRAQRAWQKVGFIQRQEFLAPASGRPFVVLTRDSERDER
jgi:[ribosomal protein S18]-alanine N-acetyltransferase